MMSLKAYHTWLNKAKKGDRVTYYRGYLVEPLLQPISPTVDRDRVTRLGKEVLKSIKPDQMIKSTSVLTAMF